MFNDLAILDVETTGGSPQRDRIIEIGILRIRRGKLAESFQSLINPDCYIPPEITMLTGIHSRQLENAPSFYSLKDKIRELLSDTIVVAHNARFDYSFIRSEFSRYDETYTSKILCTAKLSRLLFPRFRHHNLDSLIERFHIQCESRHRALDDAKVLWIFLQKISASVDMKKIADAISAVSKNVSLPPGISRAVIDTLPESPGVYIFYNAQGVPLYIGKSVNLRERVLSHFAGATTSTKEAKIFQSIASFEIQKTDGELGALLVESKLIKEYKPLYNRQLRETERFAVVSQAQNAQGYFTVSVREESILTMSESRQILAIFKTTGQMKKYLQELASEFTLCKKLLHLEAGNGPCFASQLETCRGACAGREMPAKYNLRFTDAFRKTKIKQWPFSGPIVISEGASQHIVSHWCYLGDVRNAQDIPDSLDPQDAQFDYDTYKILARHLLKDGMQRHITNLKTH